MNLILLLVSLLPLHAFAVTKVQTSETLLENEKLRLSKADHIIAEHLVKMINFAERGYINQDVLNKVTNDVKKSKHFTPFHSWLTEIQHISKLSGTAGLISHCTQYAEKKKNLALEGMLRGIAGNYCRERTLEAIGREIDKEKTLSDEAAEYIQKNLKYFLTKKNKTNFAYFIQSQNGRPEILKKISQKITTYSVLNQVVPAQEVLKDIEINEQITKLIQDKGFNPLQHQNVFYGEYGKLISAGYKLLDQKPEAKKVKEHYQFLKNYLELNQEHLPVGLCLTRLNDFSKSVFRSGYKDLAQEIYKYLLQKNNKEIQEDALFFYLWTHLYHKEYKDAYKVANSYGLIKNSKTLQDSRLKFWIAYIHEELDQKKEAIALYEDVVTNHSLSYYGIMSSKKLQALKPDSPAVTFYVSNSMPTKTSSGLSADLLDDDHVSSLVRLRAWSKIDSARMMNLELKRLRNHSMPNLLVKASTEAQSSLNSDLHLLNARLIQDSRNHLATFRYLYEVMDKKEVQFGRELLEILYPRPYLEVLMKTLRNDSLDPIVLLSLIRQESVFNPEARSHVGARGLMQLMPNTAKRFKKSVSIKQLANPQINIELGVRYFQNLMKRYDGNLVYVLAAYNAGESRVERWKGQYFDADDTILKNIEAIPFLETRNYVKLIFRNIFFYKLLIEKNEKLADVKEPNVQLGFKR
jgi:soluble lytic murein transglycosylase